MRREPELGVGEHGDVQVDGVGEVGLDHCSVAVVGRGLDEGRGRGRSRR